jgi:acyl-CoA thioester hydrolase
MKNGGMGVDSDLSPEMFASRTEIAVRFRDLDAMGHVNNAVYFTFLEQGRVQYMRDIGHVPDTQDFGERYPFVVAEAGCRYLSPVSVDERLTVHTRVSRIGNKSFGFEYLITSALDGRKVASAWSYQVCYDYRSERSRPVYDWLVKGAEELEGKRLRI